MSNREVVVLSGVRTAIADFGGSLKDVPPTDLAGQVAAEAVKRAGVEPWQPSRAACPSRPRR